MAAEATLAVLAGGEGSRMGRPKGLMEMEGRPVLGWLLERWRWAGPTLLVTAPGREHPPAWELFEREVSDPVAGLGPLRGVLTALEAAGTEMVVVATVDMPGVRAEQLAFLVEQLEAMPEKMGVLLERRDLDVEVRSGGRVLREPPPQPSPGVPGAGDGGAAGVPGAGDGSAAERVLGTMEPFPSAFRTAAAGVIGERLEAGRRAVHGLGRDPRFAVVRAPGAWEDGVWTNLNEPAELERYGAAMGVNEKGPGHGNG